MWSAFSSCKIKSFTLNSETGIETRDPEGLLGSLFGSMYKTNQQTVHTLRRGQEGGREGALKEKHLGVPRPGEKAH